MLIDTKEDHILYLTHKDVKQACSKIDSVEVLQEMFLLYEQKQAILPDEAYLGWTNEEGEFARSLNMPGFVGGEVNCAGTKIINANIQNHRRGYPRASGLLLLHDPLTARTFCVMEGAHISSLRTASVSLLAAEKLRGPDVECVAVIGAGVQAQTHIELLLQRHTLHYPALHQIVLYDISTERAVALKTALHKRLQENGIEFSVVSTPEKAVRQGQLIITATTTTEGYIPYTWLQPGAILVHVSLDDVLPEVVFQAASVIVDDWPLVKHDPRRLLGRMYRAGEIVGPDEEYPTGNPHCRRIDAELGAVVAGKKSGRRQNDDIILVNPFGLAIEDVSLGAAVYHRACELQLGQWLTR